jgi:hypothetical protein
MRLSEISRVIGSPKNSTSHLVRILMVRGYEERDQATMIVRPTEKLLRLGQPRVGRVSLVECALEPMRALRDAVGETVQLGIPLGGEGVIGNLFPLGFRNLRARTAERFFREGGFPSAEAERTGIPVGRIGTRPLPANPPATALGDALRQVV